jgi:hypothetical protein
MTGLKLKRMNDINMLFEKDLFLAAVPVGNERGPSVVADRPSKGTEEHQPW